MTSPRLIVFDTTKNSNSMLICRGSYPVYAPNKTPFATLLEAAANIELSFVGLATRDAPTIQATLNEFDFSSLGDGKWEIDATFVAEGKDPISVKSVYEYPVSIAAASSCGDVTNAMPAGIEAFLNKLYSDPRFQELFH